MAAQYRPKWKGTLTNEERQACFRSALARLGEGERAEMEALVDLLEAGAKNAGAKNFGEHGALELLAAVGMWLAAVTPKPGGA